MIFHRLTLDGTVTPLTHIHSALTEECSVPEIIRYGRSTALFKKGNSNKIFGEEESVQFCVDPAFQRAADNWLCGYLLFWWTILFLNETEGFDLRYSLRQTVQSSSTVSCSIALSFMTTGANKMDYKCRVWVKHSTCWLAVHWWRAVFAMFYFEMRVPEARWL